MSKKNQFNFSRIGITLSSFVLFLMTIHLFGCNTEEPDPCEEVSASYIGDIKPVVDVNCAIAGCHVSGGDGNGDFTTYAGLKDKFDNGSLKFLVLTAGTMPPDTVATLTQAQLDQFDCWIQAGAPEN